MAPTRSLLRTLFFSAVGLVALASPVRADKRATHAWIVAAQITPAGGPALAPVTLPIDGDVGKPQCGGFQNLDGWDLEVCRMGGDAGGSRLRVRLVHQAKTVRQSYEGELHIGRGRHTIVELPGGSLAVEVRDPS